MAKYILQVQTVIHGKTASQTKDTMTARMQRRIAKATCCANLRRRSTVGRCLGISLAYTVESHKCQDVHAMKTENMLPLVNEYGYLHTSQVFFLLCESHVVKLNDASALSREAQKGGEHTSLGGYTGSSPSIYRGERAVDPALQAHCIFCKCLDLRRLQILVSVGSGFQAQYLEHRPSW
jgi:hypothetical protein